MCQTERAYWDTQYNWLLSKDLGTCFQTENVLYTLDLTQQQSEYSEKGIKGNLDNLLVLLKSILSAILSYGILYLYESKTKIISAQCIYHPPKRVGITIPQN